MKHKFLYVVVLLLVLAAITLASCQSKATPTQSPAVEPTKGIPAPTEAAIAPTQATASKDVCKGPVATGIKPDCHGYGKDGKCKVVLVNSYLGNDYRIQMQKAATAASLKEPYASVIDFSILNTDNTPEAQRAGIENLLAEGVDGIILNAVDSKSMNDTVVKACDKGVKVVTFDITAKPGACEKAVEFRFDAYNYDAGNYLGTLAGIKDHPINVILDKGLSGAQIADDAYQNWIKGMTDAAGGKKENINIIGEYYSQFAEGPQEPAISAILAANPDKKIDAVFSQGYCTTVASAFENAGLKYYPLIKCEGYNGSTLLLLDKKIDGFVSMPTWGGSVGSLDAAYRWIMGEDVPKTIAWPAKYVITKDIGWKAAYPAAIVEMAKVGLNAFPDLPAGFGPFLGWKGSCADVTVQDVLGK
jgi:ribose transport system substrate-binding protein